MCPRPLLYWPLPFVRSAQLSHGPRYSFKLSAAHAEVNVEDVSFDLVTGSVLRKLSHLQHVNDATWISVAPIDELMQNQIEV
jgi:hypothetical protein